jgi:protein KRI1
VEEKYNKPAKPANGKLYGDKYDEDSESSDEDEDDEGFLATEDLDAEISATLQALRSKDPRVYDEKVTFYKPVTEGEAKVKAGSEKGKPMYLHDYHRENLLKGVNGDMEEDDLAPRTFVQEQEDLQRSIVKEMHAAGDPESEDEDGGFLIPKSKPQTTATAATTSIHPSRAKRVKIDLDVESADKDPETFLSNFMQARAWVPSDGARFQPLESDDDEEVDRAEAWENAYNMRFENPAGANENLRSYARDIIAAKSVRREEPNSRKKQRDAQREKKEAEKAERDDERTRLRQLKIGEMEEKLQKIKKAAGIRGKTLKDDDWTKVLENDWDDDTWEAEMKAKFGENYYAEQEAGSDSEADSNDKKKKIRKPKWDDDIDIKDLVPDFIEEEEAQEKPAFTLSDDEDRDDEEQQDLDVDMDEDSPKKKSKSSKDRAKEKAEKKRAARIERKKIEDLVDNQLDLTLPLATKTPAVFRYRETSPISFGLTARDILMAPDTSLNQFAGLKKMAAFRDADKKRKDKKNLGKKARLRQWRKETFGNEDGPEIVIQDGGLAEEKGDVEEGKKKKKRSRKNKTKSAETEV